MKYLYGGEVASLILTSQVQRRVFFEKGTVGHVEKPGYTGLGGLENSAVMSTVDHGEAEPYFERAHSSNLSFSRTLESNEHDRIDI